MSSLLTFKAGKMKFGSDNKKLSPLTDKGQIILSQNDGLLHFKWMNRTTGQTEDDLIIFPGDAVFKKVKQTSDRVYCLHFTNSGRRLFFWLQDKDASKDESNADQLTRLLNNPPQQEDSTGASAITQSSLQQAAASASAAAAAAAAAATSSSSSSSSATTAPTTATGGSTGTQAASAASDTAATPTPMDEQPPDNTNNNSNSNSSTSGGGLNVNFLSSLLQSMGSGGKQPDGVQSLLSVLTADEISPLLTDEVRAQLVPLIEHLPASETAEPGAAGEGATRRPVDLILETVRSPQFKQTLKMFDNALNSGEAVEAILSTMKVRMPAAHERAGKTGVQIFLDALLNHFRDHNKN